MLTRIKSLLLLATLFACAGTQSASRGPESAPTPSACAEACREELRTCMGNTLEDSRYSTCMPENEACVTACYDVI